MAAAWVWYLYRLFSDLCHGLPSTRCGWGRDGFWDGHASDWRDVVVMIGGAGMVSGCCMMAIHARAML